jgi:tRNA A-37 threonylcarbamoyl transferase component Bud32
VTDAADKKKKKKKHGTSAMADPFVGRTIGGCRIIERIGRGAMAVVYKSEQISLNRTVALKLLDEGAADEEGALGRFFREARSAARLVHPNVVQVFDVGVDQSIPHIIMEFVDGETLYDRIQRDGRVPAPEALEIVRQAGLALVRAQEFDIVHRDIKPANVMVSRRGEVKLADFGLAKVTSDTSVTRVGSKSALGTPYYLSPEQGEGGPLDVRSDIYGLGATFYHLVTGRPPFTGSTAQDIIHAHAKTPLVPACRAEPSVPRAVSDVIDKMMAKSPDERYPSARALLAAISGVKRALAAGAGNRPKPRTEMHPAVGVTGRRSYKRLAADLVGEIRRISGPEGRLDEIRSRVKALSKRGVFVETSATAPVGSVVEMKLRMGPHAPEIRAIGVVRWSSPEAGRSGMGVQFVELDARSAGGVPAGAGEGPRGLRDLTRTPRHEEFLRLHAASQGDAMRLGEIAGKLDATRGLVRLILRAFAEHGMVKVRGDFVEFLVPEDEELRREIARYVGDASRPARPAGEQEGDKR